MKLDYQLPELTIKNKRILAFDPGSVNMGISIVELNKIPTVRANATMMHPIHDIKQFMKEKRLFVNEVSQWIEYYKPTAIIAERFQSRGLRGATVECVSMMLGILSTFNLPCCFITASTWKNNYQRRFNVNLREIYKTLYNTPHQLDASLIGCFGIETAMKQKYDFKLDNIIQQVEDNALNGLKKR